LNSLNNQQKAVLEELSKIQSNFDKLDEARDEEIEKVEQKYRSLKVSKLDTVNNLVSGGRSTLSNSSEQAVRIPSFWFHVLSNSRLFHQEIHFGIQTRDEDVLKNYLEGVTFGDSSDDKFTWKYIDFHFKENPYFENKVLSKLFDRMEKGKSDDLVPLGTDIKWKEGKNLSVKSVNKKVKKKQGPPKILSKLESCPSFFNFFRIYRGKTGSSTTEMTTVDEIEEENPGVFDDMDVCDELFEEVLPNAIRLYMTGKTGMEDDSDQDDDDEKKGGVDNEEDDDNDDGDFDTTEMNELEKKILMLKVQEESGSKSSTNATSSSNNNARDQPTKNDIKDRQERSTGGGSKQHPFDISEFKELNFNRISPQQLQTSGDYFTDIENSLLSVIPGDGLMNNAIVTFYSVSARERAARGSLDVLNDGGKLKYLTMTRKRFLEYCDRPTCVLVVRTFHKNPDPKKKNIPLKRIYSFIAANSKVVLRSSKEFNKESQCVDELGKKLEPEDDTEYM